MTKEEYLEQFKNSLSKKEVLALVEQASQDVNDCISLLELSFNERREIAFRAAWVLEYTLEERPEVLVSFLPAFLHSYPKQKNQSCRRHFTKILMYVSNKKLLRLLQGYDLSPAINATFEWLIESDTPVAVRVNCMDILFQLREYEDWLEDGLKAQIEFFLKDGGAAMQSRGRKLLKQLNKPKAI